MAERLQKILSQWGIASRRQAEKMIEAGRVRVNGTVVGLGQTANPEQDQIQVDGKLVLPAHRPQMLYILLYKPAGVVSTCRDPQKRRTVLDLLPPPLREGQGLHPVGRLDAESTGALLLTNDGEMTLRLTHPRYHLPKNYQVWIQGHPPEEVLKSWRQGILLSGKKTLPAQVCVLDVRGSQTCLEVILTEGRNRQIRRIAEQLGYPVIHLHRAAIGPICLKRTGEPMFPGTYRFLEDFEISFLQNQVNLTSIEVPADIKERRV
ncbi:pseudouridine synthase [Coleofasciculus sp. FACHB-1120]|uniref:pseudouridine synthase n=1 Tax=Coleofasciculus sp. FACHB-1120 TaxID=2692783 RepID=UPI001684A9CF|nr:pseudouridine synthase [Coleofasciculus sp. FACHB-1120]MBD2740487.1 rRNA pseudouridine synthase [Coleofasciculus sp. FACHB-1120]